MERIKQCKGMAGQRPTLNRARSWVFLILMVAMPALTMSCSGPQVQKNQAQGVYHIVKKGETAYTIARAYSIRLQDLEEENNITDASILKEGTVIFIPNVEQVIDDVFAQAQKNGKQTKPGDASQMGAILPDQPKRGDKAEPLEKEPAGAASGTKPPEKPRMAEKEEDVKIEKGLFAWPVKGTVKSRFGIQPNKTYHNWIKMSCLAGARVKAASSGTIIYSAGLKDFGETIIIRHPNEYATVYTHLKKRLVKADQSVKKGDIIAVAGEMDETGDAYVNFEIRYKGKARNPLLYLP